MVIKRNGLLSFWWVCGESVSEEEEEGFGRAWKRNLGLASSSKNSIFGQRSRSRPLPQTLYITVNDNCLGFILFGKNGLIPPFLSLSLSLVPFIAVCKIFSGVW